MTRIRPAEPADHEALVEQFTALNVFEDTIAHDRRTDREGGEISLTAAWTAIRNTGGHALVAELDGQVVGHLFMVFRADDVFIREEFNRHAYVAELFVRPEARRQGIARALLDAAENLARAAGLPRLTLGVLAGNDQAHALYLNSGFIPRAFELQKTLD